MEEIRITCEGASRLDYKVLKDFQGKLKNLSDENYLKLRKEILELGFTEPISVWRKGKDFHILNGHQRVKALKRMNDEGFKVPRIPVNWVDAKNLKEAKLKVLALTSQYGNLTMDGLTNFITDAGLTMAEVKDSFRFPEINFQGFGATKPEKKAVSFSANGKPVEKCETCGQKIKPAVEQRKNNDGEG